METVFFVLLLQAGEYPKTSMQIYRILFIYFTKYFRFSKTLRTFFGDGQDENNFYNQIASKMGSSIPKQAVFTTNTD